VTTEELVERINKLIAEHGGSIPESSSSWDNECAHLDEDEIYNDVFKAIRDGAMNAKELAAECVRLSELPFNRWYA